MRKCTEIPTQYTQTRNSGTSTITSYINYCDPNSSRDLNWMHVVSAFHTYGARSCIFWLLDGLSTPLRPQHMHIFYSMEKSDEVKRTKKKKTKYTYITTNWMVVLDQESCPVLYFCCVAQCFVYISKKSHRTAHWRCNRIACSGRNTYGTAMQNTMHGNAFMTNRAVQRMRWRQSMIRALTYMWKECALQRVDEKHGTYIHQFIWLR